MNSTHEITNLLQAWNEGDPEALNQLVPLADRELKKIARKFLSRERRNHILQPTALVNEAWMKLFREKEEVDWKNRRHFYSLLAWRMRQVLFNYAGTEAKPQYTGLTDKVLSREESKDIIVLHQALDKFTHVNKRAAQVVELRYFGGYTIDDVAEILDIGTATVEREWRFAKSWLWNEMTSTTTRPPTRRSH